MKREIRIPKQKRSIEKKKKLTEAAYKLFNEKGYYNINTAEIAAEAGLSTGCLYDYFIDKDDIFLDAIRIHNEESVDIIRTDLAMLPDDIDLMTLMEQFICIFMKAHNHSAGFHREVMALSLTKPELYTVMESVNNPETVTMINTFLQKHNVNVSNSNEKIQLLLNTVDGLCHDLLYKKMDWIDQDIYINECAKMLVHLLAE